MSFDKQKEILELKKTYLDQIEKFDTKIYFTFLSLSISLILINFKFPEIANIQNLLLWIGIILMFITTLPLELILDIRRKNYFNSLINQINNGKFELIK